MSSYEIKSKLLYWSKALLLQLQQFGQTSFSGRTTRHAGCREEKKTWTIRRNSNFQRTGAVCLERKGVSTLLATKLFILTCFHCNTVFSILNISVNLRAIVVIVCYFLIWLVLKKTLILSIMSYTKRMLYTFVHQKTTYLPPSPCFPFCHMTRSSQSHDLTLTGRDWSRKNRGRSCGCTSRTV